MLRNQQWTPMIVFSFARRECEHYTLHFASHLDLLSADEKKLVAQICDNALDSLAEEDRQLHQITSLLPILHRGIAPHHSGLLPILKEIVEILFQESLIKILFATETFALGINAPAKTVLFTELIKVRSLFMSFANCVRVCRFRFLNNPRAV